MIRLIKYVGLGLLASIILVFLISFIFISTNPEFGGTLSEDQKTAYATSINSRNGIFVNQIPTTLDRSFSGSISILWDFMNPGPNISPNSPINVQKIDSLTIKDNDLTRITWFGHSAFLLEIDGINLLLDPMFGDVPAPHPLLGSSRYSNELPISIENLPPISAVLFSHDHYDHLDYGSVMKLKDKVNQFYVPLGFSVHLEEWGIEKHRIHELDWWDEIKHDSLTLAFTPARHFSGRGLSDTDQTLWGSWVIQSSEKNIYFSGDSGYGTHFQEIGEKYGPFDFAMMECGQYNEKWKDIHLMPEETVTASIDLKAKLMMPIHWGAFTLALHEWTDPVIRATKEAERLNLPIATPRIGEPVILGDSLFPSSRWWEAYN